MKPSTPGTLALVGADIGSCALAERERLACSPEETAAVLARARTVRGVREALVLSTCNRTEFYLVVDDRGAPERWVDRVAEHRGEDARRAFRKGTRLGDEAVRHLMRVACGLESRLLGDAHIAGQLRAAFTQAASAGAVGPVLTQLARQATHVARRARRTTRIGYGASSLGAAVTALVRQHQVPASGRPRPILIVGAGAVARDVSAHLAKAGCGPLQWTNRSADGARRLADEFAGETAAWADLDSAAGRAAVVITAVSAVEPIMSAERLHRAASASSPRPVFIDLGVPRNLPSDAGAEIITIDDVHARRDHVLALRQAAVPEVESLVDEELLAWHQWLAQRPLEQVIKALFLEERQRRTELVTSLEEQTGLDRTAVEQLVRKTVRGLLHGHVSALRRSGVLLSAMATPRNTGAFQGGRG